MVREESYRRPTQMLTKKPSRTFGERNLNDVTVQDGWRMSGKTEILPVRKLMRIRTYLNCRLSSSVTKTYNSAFYGRGIRPHAAVAFGHDGIPKGLACVPVSTS